MDRKITLILIVFSCFDPARAMRDMDIGWQMKLGILQRMIKQMRTFYIKLDERTTDLHSIRFKFDHSKEFEEGYLMAVIIEKYRQAVEHTKISRRMKAFALYDLMLRADMVQRIYVDIFRLVNMMHEIPRKYGFDIRKRKRSTVKGNPEELIWAVKHLQVKEVNRKKNRRQKLKELKRLREMMQLAGENLTMTPRTTRKHKQRWGFQDYGWEFSDEYWEEW